MEKSIKLHMVYIISKEKREKGNRLSRRKER